jgi:hypothetical protein
MDQTKMYLAKKTPLGTIGEGEGFGKWIPASAESAANLFSKIISNTIGVMTIFAGVWFIFQFITGAYGWLSAGSDKNAIQQAQQRLTNAFIGLVVIVAAYSITWLFGKLLGFEILQPQEILKNL